MRGYGLKLTWFFKPLGLSSSQRHRAMATVAEGRLDRIILTGRRGLTHKRRYRRYLQAGRISGPSGDRARRRGATGFGPRSGFRVLRQEEEAQRV